MSGKNNITSQREGGGARRGTPKMFCKAKILGDNERQDPRSEPVRGYIKLSNAARAFNFDFRDKIVLDIGSSTGGFTALALEKGAKKVIAVEKGTNQMRAPLRHDHRVDLHEKTDIFSTEIQIAPSEGIRSLARRGRAPVARGDGPTGRGPRKGAICISVQPIGIIMADVSFVSLRKILAYARCHLSTDSTEFLVMLKPQFEASQSDLNKGIVKNESIRRKIIKDFEQWLKNNHFIIVKKRDSSLHGKTGNLERFYWLKIAK